MEVSQAVRIGYKNALTGMVVSSVSVPVFDMGGVPETQQEPYVIISTSTVDQIAVDRCKIYACTQLVDIVTSSKTPFGFDQAMAIAAEVESRINPDSFADIDITSNGYRIGETRLMSSSNELIKTQTKYVYRVLKRFTHLVSKTT